MTAVWDEVEEFLGHVGELKDPDLYAEAMRYFKQLIDDIHEFDHQNLGRYGAKHEPVARYLTIHSKGLEEINDFNRRVREKRSMPPTGHDDQGAHPEHS